MVSDSAPRRTRTYNPLIKSEGAAGSKAEQGTGLRPGDKPLAAGLQKTDCLSPELARVIDAWDELPLHIRTSILALADAAKARG